MSLNDVGYGRLVDILDQSQGNLLRAFGTAVLPIVEALIGGSAHPQRSFKLEKVTASDITKCSKGSQALLELFSETT
jgi:hypothetical protein